MSDPHRSGAEDTGPSAVSYPPYPDPAYAGQLPMYGAGYPPAYSPNPTGQSAPGYWSPGQPPPGQPPPGQPPSGGPSDGGNGARPEPPRPPGWLWVLAGVTVVLVVGLVIALVIANGSAKKPSVSQSPPPTMPSMTAPPRIPTTVPTRPRPPRSTAPTAPPPPSEPNRSGAAQTIVYNVTGEGRAISIAYIDTGGVLQTEFNVMLPWSKEVRLAPPASTAASVTVVNVGEQVTCSVSVNGEQVRQRSGTILTICATAG